MRIIDPEKPFASVVNDPWVIVPGALVLLSLLPLLFWPAPPPHQEVDGIPVALVGVAFLMVFTVAVRLLMLFFTARLDRWSMSAVIVVFMILMWCYFLSAAPDERQLGVGRNNRTIVGMPDWAWYATAIGLTGLGSWFIYLLLAVRPKLDRHGDS